ncbi:MAG: LysR family transcriptional regulator, partial [Treponemataceae bacterium]|nr:LysR family transcriptional regulator [Treponemataceae bacterium]
MIELRLLRYFLAVANEGSITRAAEVVHTSQPNLSRQMQELEESLGCRLFERGKTVSLTDSGEFLKRRAAEILGLAAKTEAELSSEGISGTLSVGFGEMKCVNDVARLAV